MFQENHKSVLLNSIINAQVNICTYLKNKKKNFGTSRYFVSQINKYRIFSIFNSPSFSSTFQENPSPRSQQGSAIDALDDLIGADLFELLEVLLDLDVGGWLAHCEHVRVRRPHELQGLEKGFFNKSSKSAWKAKVTYLIYNLELAKKTRRKIIISSLKLTNYLFYLPVRSPCSWVPWRCTRCTHRLRTRPRSGHSTSDWVSGGRSHKHQGLSLAGEGAHRLKLVIFKSHYFYRRCLI